MPEPRILTTAAELDALPEGSVVRATAPDYLDEFDTYVKDTGGRWFRAGYAGQYDPGPLTSYGDTFVVLYEPGRRPSCGGCRGLGAHSPACNTQPGARWYRYAQQAENLGDYIGSSDIAAANAAYYIAGRMNALRRAEQESNDA